jgi:hypothetical protein
VFWGFVTHRSLGTWLSNRGDEQVIAPFLIILRVANRSALTSDTITSGKVGSLHFKSEGKSTSDNGILPDEYPTSSTEANGGAPGKLVIEVETAVAEVPS